MAISRDDVLHVAKLAELDLSDEEVDRFQEQLSAILEAVGKVSQLDLTDVPPTAHPLSSVNVFGPDEPQPSLALEDVFLNAAAREDDLFRVPPSA
jgi:aspartyl-tRNA(Asn)/glutamyl-tRNA(Gln) amidotransferase subunit C